MTYVNKKTRLFLDRGDIRPERRRSEARLKTYPSSIDVRAWCDIVEDRRQHILELVYKGREKCRGTLIPIEAIISALIGNRLTDCEKLKKCMKQLWDFISSLNLNDEDKKKLEAMTEAMDSICAGKKRQAGAAALRRLRTDDDDECVASDRHRRELEEVNNLLSDIGEGGTYKVTAKGPARITTRIKGYRQGPHPVPGPKGTITTRAQGPARIISKLGKVFDNGQPGPQVHVLPHQSQSLEQSRQSQQFTKEQPESMSEFRPLLNSSMIEAEGKQIGVPRMQLETPAANKTEELKVQLEARETLCNELQLSLENIKTEKDNLKKQLESALEELETLKKLNAANPIIPSSCKEEIEALELEIKVMRSGNLSPEQEAEVIRKEVEVLKKYCLKLKSVEDENEKLKIERDTLKSQVTLSEDPGSEKQKSAKDNLNRQVAGIVGDTEKLDENPSKDPSEMKDKEDAADVEELKNKLNNLEEITKERDMLANKVQRLEKELLQYRDLPEDLEVYRNRSKMLDSALEERDKMSKKVEQIKSIEDELNQLRKKSSRVDELEEELKSHTKNDKNAGSELKKAKSKCACLEKELQNVKMERDSMRTRIDYMKKEIEMLRAKSKEAELYRLERDKLQIKLNELSHTQIQYENLQLKCKCLENAAAEKAMYKQKYEEMVTMECQGDMLRSQVESAKNLEREKNALVKQVGDLESCICDQEDEIKKLVMQIDNLCRNKDENQCRMREALGSMRAEIEKKDCLIAESEQKLAAVQTQLKSSIQGVSCETTCYKTRIEDLERELKKAHTEINCLHKQVGQNGSCLKDIEQLKKAECETVSAMKRELNNAHAENKKLRDIAGKMAALTGDEHVRTMLKQSECAVKRVVEELGRQYKEWDTLKHKHKKGIYVHCPCKRNKERRPMSDSENEKLIEELEDIQREKAKLEQLVKQIQDDKVSEGPQKELIALRIENTKLQERLEREAKQRKELEKRVKVSA